MDVVNETNTSTQNIENNKPTEQDILKGINDRKAMTKSLVPNSISALRSIPPTIGASENQINDINKYLDGVFEIFEKLTEDINIHYDKPQLEDFNIVPKNA